jgi:hypothetical protein
MAGEGHNSDRTKFLRALALSLKDDRDMEAIRARRNANRKQFRTFLELGHLDQTKKMLTWSPEERADHFNTQLRYLSYANIQVGVQMDLFNGAGAAVATGVDWHAEGLFAGLAGEDGIPPENLSQEDGQRWLAGWQDGQRELCMALQEQKEGEDIDEAGDEDDDAQPETSVRDQAAADFAEDNPDVQTSGDVKADEAAATKPTRKAAQSAKAAAALEGAGIQ